MRLLGILVQSGFLQRTSHGHYRAGLKLWRIGASALEQGAVREGVIFVLRQLVALTAESAQYSVYEHGYSVCIESMDGIHPVRHSTAIGDMSPAYASATGKALLAWQEPSEVRRVAAGGQPLTPNTPVGVDAIVSLMAKIRADGYCVDRGEWKSGVLGIAAPVFGRTGSVVAAIGVSGPEERVEPRVESYVDAVGAAARTVSMQRGAL
jgi:IclR family KDG regulon transcriptional repressor